jgi:hypothetical protein
MFTSVFHIFFAGKQDAISGLFWCLDKKIRSLNGLTRHFVYRTNMTLVHLVIISEGNSRRGLNFCTLIYTRFPVVFREFSTEGISYPIVYSFKHCEGLLS